MRNLLIDHNINVDNVFGFESDCLDPNCEWKPMCHFLSIITASAPQPSRSCNLKKVPMVDLVEAISSQLAIPLTTWESVLKPPSPNAISIRIQTSIPLLTLNFSKFRERVLWSQTKAGETLGQGKKTPQGMLPQILSHSNCLMFYDLGIPFYRNHRSLRLGSLMRGNWHATFDRPSISLAGRPRNRANARSFRSVLSAMPSPRDTPDQETSNLGHAFLWALTYNRLSLGVHSPASTSISSSKRTEFNIRSG